MCSEYWNLRKENLVDFFSILEVFNMCKRMGAMDSRVRNLHCAPTVINLSGVLRV